MRYGPYVTVLRVIYRFFARKYRVIGAENLQSPTVLVSRHKDGRGGLAILAWMPIDFRLWVLDKLATYKPCLQHHMEYFCPVRLGYGPVRTWLYSHLVSWPFSRCFVSMRAISVYRSERGIMKTMHESLETLKNGDCVCVLPDVEYTAKDDQTGTMYDGFLYLARMAYQESKQILSFTPVYPSVKHRLISIGKPIVYQPSEAFRNERQRIMQEIKKSLDEMARSCGNVEEDFGVDGEASSL